ncbi:hypothetical protein O6H91_22G014200 [Diphasiastrum complanatum]|uniref:Uncharacterized protein n=1 Tax=Diphasiastrum complanatum TaxID=34168 RepID=A0ACC2AD66_DIPCM|nr:hypothetical protein O6H91_22G014200 [Diphasiastrum complanatum]
MQGFDCQNVLSRRARSFKLSPIQQLSLLAQRCNAINLAEGFPDFPAPLHIKEAAVAAITADFNQYRHVQGVCEKVASAFEMAHGVKVDPATEVTLCCGQSEALAAAILAVVEANDEVVILEPAYDTYEACTILAGGKPVFVSLDPPFWSLDLKKLDAAIGPKTKAVIINSPHNPTGKVFSKVELADITNLCCKHGCLAITDEVYEHITFDDVKHVSLASFPGMKERTIVTSSLSKTFGVTGWRIGWAIAPSALTSAIQIIHTKLTDSAPAPFQEAALTALQSCPDFYKSLKQEYQFRRDYIEYVMEAINTLGIAFVPGCAFFNKSGAEENLKFHVSTDLAKKGLQMPRNLKGSNDASENLVSNPYKHRYIRVAFCKDISTLQAAKLALRRQCK